MITSLPPFATSVGWRIDFRYSNGFSCGAPHLPIASIWAGAIFPFTSGSRFSLRSRNRVRNSRPAAWLLSERVKCTSGQKRRVALDKIEKVLRRDAKQSCIGLVLRNLDRKDRSPIHPAKGLEIAAVVENRDVLGNADFSGFRHRLIHHAARKFLLKALGPIPKTPARFARIK